MNVAHYLGKCGWWRSSYSLWTVVKWKENNQRWQPAVTRDVEGRSVPRGRWSRWMFEACVCVFYVFLCGLVQSCPVFRAHLVFLVDKTVRKQKAKRVWHAYIIPHYDHLNRTNSYFQNKCYSRIDSMSCSLPWESSNVQVKLTFRDWETWTHVIHSKTTIASQVAPQYHVVPTCLLISMMVEGEVSPGTLILTCHSLRVNVAYFHCQCPIQIVKNPE